MKNHLFGHRLWPTLLERLVVVSIQSSHPNFEFLLFLEFCKLDKIEKAMKIDEFVPILRDKFMTLLILSEK